jgi:hypothetical protein
MKECNIYIFPATKKSGYGGIWGCIKSQKGKLEIDDKDNKKIQIGKRLHKASVM